MLHASAEALNGARVAAAIMGTNNIYYRLIQLVGDAEYGTLRANLRMNAMANPGCDRVDFELASLAVSVVNGCGGCLESRNKDPAQARSFGPADPERGAHCGSDPCGGSGAGAG